MAGIESIDTVEFLKLVIGISATVGAFVAGSLRSGEALIGKKRFYKQGEIAHFTEDDRKKLGKVKDVTIEMHEAQERAEWKRDQERDRLRDVERELKLQLKDIQREIKNLA